MKYLQSTPMSQDPCPHYWHLLIYIISFDYTCLFQNFLISRIWFQSVVGYSPIRTEGLLHNYLHLEVFLFFIVLRSSSFIHEFFLLLQTQGMIDVCTWWYGTLVRELDWSFTFVRGWLGGLTPFLPYFPL